jgi:PPM family protein phosphatase
VVSALKKLSEQMRREGWNRPDLDSMGATIVLAQVRGRQTLIGHLGDSRAYLLRKGCFQQLTKDHSLAQSLVDCGELTPEEAAVYPMRSRLTRHIGMNGATLPDVRLLDLCPDDLLLLCSDGLSEAVSELEMMRVLQKGLSPEMACQRLIESSLAAGGNDNVTALIISFQAMEQ